MRVRNPLLQGVIILAAAFSIAVVANAFAGRERRLVLPGWYPNATKVPPPAAPAPPPVSTEPATPAPPLAVPEPAAPATTTTIAPPVTTTTTQAPPPAPAAPEQHATPVKPKIDPLVKFQPHPNEAYIEISGDDARALHAAGALFLDARRTSVYEAGHIPGARSFSVWEADIDDKVNALFGERSDPASQNKPIVAYCSGGACEDSHMLAQKLWGIQFNNVYVYKDGFPDWQDRGGKVVTGAQP